jgi:hypothetical protein
VRWSDCIVIAFALVVQQWFLLGIIFRDIEQWLVQWRGFVFWFVLGFVFWVKLG